MWCKVMARLSSSYSLLLVVGMRYPSRCFTSHLLLLDGQGRSVNNSSGYKIIIPVFVLLIVST